MDQVVVGARRRVEEWTWAKWWLEHEVKSKNGHGLKLGMLDWHSGPYAYGFTLFLLGLGKQGLLLKSQGCCGNVGCQLLVFCSCPIRFLPWATMAATVVMLLLPLR
ncbi:hypothetical protein ACFX13_034719 [Malus domestica]